MTHQRFATLVTAGCLWASGGVSPDAHASPQHADDHQTEGQHDADSDSRFLDEPIPLKIEGFPQRPKPLLELGSPFLGTGPLDPGFEMPGGAVWQPQLLLYGEYRTALQTADDGFTQTAEWANRLDLFFNLQLTGTERLVYGIRPLDQDNRFSGFQWEPESRSVNEFNWRTTTLFFEGDVGELLPGLDPEDKGQTDWGFSVGRQPIVFQGGLLMNDFLDSVAIVRDTLYPPFGGSDLRLTFLWAWDDVDRDNNREAGDDLFALLAEADYPKSTWQVDFVYVNDDHGDTDGFFWGAGAIQRIGQINTTFRALGSYALDEESPAVSSGHLLFTEVSWTPHHSEDLVYVNAFWGIDQFSSAARGPDAGGPLGRTGILFAAVGLGNYPAALGNRADDSAGAALGWQMFFDKEHRRQLILETGARTTTKGEGLVDFAGAARYQQAIGQHAILQFDLFGGLYETRDNGYGARVELRFKF